MNTDTPKTNENNDKEFLEKAKSSVLIQSEEISTRPVVKGNFNSC
jgi:hypothetical protein